MKIKQENLTLVAECECVLFVDDTGYTRDIANQLGVSVATVHRALTGKKNNVNSVTYYRIRELALTEHNAYPVKIVKMRL